VVDRDLDRCVGERAAVPRPTPFRAAGVVNSGRRWRRHANVQRRRVGGLRWTFARVIGVNVHRNDITSLRWTFADE
jgi:hypothetical protein